MTGKNGNFILIAMLAGAILGVLAGFYLPEFMLETSFVGTMFLNALKMVVIPLVVVMRDELTDGSTQRAFADQHHPFEAGLLDRADPQSRQLHMMRPLRNECFASPIPSIR